MATSVHITDAAWPDRDYVDGELVERNVGQYEYARLQAPLAL
jgi:hypothetical protein